MFLLLFQSIHHFAYHIIACHKHDLYFKFLFNLVRYFSGTFRSNCHCICGIGHIADCSNMLHLTPDSFLIIIIIRFFYTRNLPTNFKRILSNPPYILYNLLRLRITYIFPVPIPYNLLMLHILSSSASSLDIICNLYSFHCFFAFL